MQEIYFPKFSEFEEVTDGKFSVEEIFEMESKILTSLKWMMNPTTLNNWAGYYTTLWDKFACENPQNFEILSPDS